MDGTVMLWRVDNVRADPLVLRPARRGRVSGLAFSSDGTMLAMSRSRSLSLHDNLAGTPGFEVEVWNVPNARVPTAELIRSIPPSNRFCFSPVLGSSLLALDDKLLDVRTGQQVLSFGPPDRLRSEVAFPMMGQRWFTSSVAPAIVSNIE
jgi:hypothetical protein